MNTTLLDEIVNAVLYEGYLLYPYRPSSKKNSRERFTFGRVYPEAYSAAQGHAEPCVIQTECLLQCHNELATIEASVRFLHPLWREVGVLPATLSHLPKGAEPEYQVVPKLAIDGELYQTWQEAVEREVKFLPVSLEPGQHSRVNHPFAVPASRTLEPLLAASGNVVGVMARRQEALAGTFELEMSPVGAGCFRIKVRILNQTPVSEAALEDQDAIIMRTLVSTHTILHAPNAEFISMTDPPREHKRLAEACTNIGSWPVLVGDAESGERDTMLSSPIILYDYPKLAPESVGDFFDGTEIDQMLTLRVLTMTEEEKREMRSVDDFARQILQRTEAVSPDHFLKMHGTMRDMKPAEEFFNPADKIDSAMVKGVEIKPGDRVRICPKSRADALDFMLAGKTAIVEAVERDVENKIHFAVVMEDDPGKDLGRLRQPGHRFFYGLEEIELLKDASV